MYNVSHWWDRRTESKQTLWLFELLTEPKKIDTVFSHNIFYPCRGSNFLYIREILKREKGSTPGCQGSHSSQVACGFG